jgi:hypothetical protein
MKVQIARINRKLAKQGQKLCTSRSYGEKSNLGDYHVVDLSTNTVIGFRITDLDEFEKDLAKEAGQAMTDDNEAPRIKHLGTIEADAQTAEERTALRIIVDVSVEYFEEPETSGCSEAEFEEQLIKGIREHLGLPSTVIEAETPKAHRSASRA